MRGILLMALLLASAAGTGAAEQVVFEARPAVREVTLFGFTRARARMALVAETEGRVLRVAADIGEPIPEDGVLACLDRTFLELDLAANGVEQKRLESDLAYFRKEVERYRDLVRRNTAAQSELDRLQRELSGSRQSLAGARVAEQRLQERLARTCIPAPPGWRVTARDVEPGQWVAVGQRVAEVGDFRTLLIPYALSPRELASLRAGADALSVYLTELDRQVPARIERLSPAFDPETRKVQVDLAVDRGLPEHRGGLRAALTVTLAEDGGAVMVPAAALTERYEQYFLTREGGEEVAVVRLGDGSGPFPDTVRVVSPEVAPGQRFVTPAPR
jgi:membrane fusion protein (multidrug efflux system)